MPREGGIDRQFVRSTAGAASATGRASPEGRRAAHSAVRASMGSMLIEGTGRKR